MNNIYIAYALWFFTGWLGGHRLYLGKFISGFLMMALFAIGSATYWFLIGWVFFAIWGVWWLFDVFLTGSYVEENLRKERLKGDLRAQDRETELTRLYELFEDGKISKAEFEARRDILLR